jgi:hypothetical protein
LDTQDTKRRKKQKRDKTTHPQIKQNKEKN